MSLPEEEVQSYKILHCTDCNRKFSFSMNEQIHYQEKKYETPKRCSPCRKARNKAKREMTTRFMLCIDCNRKFSFSVNEQVHYQKKKYEPPKRCLPCRKAKQEKERKFKRSRMPNRKPGSENSYRSGFSKPARGSIRRFG